MIARLLFPAHARRGVMLVYVVCLIPVALVLLMEAMTRLELDVQETHREECRLQARLLAESALVLWRSRPAGTETREEIPGVGAIILEVAGEGTSPRRVTARGIVADQRGESIYEIQAQAQAGGAALSLLGAAASLRPESSPAPPSATGP